MALLLARRVNESIHLRLHPDANANELLMELATTGIDIHIAEVKRNSVVTAVVAPLGVTILRGELITENFEIRQQLKGRFVRWLRLWRKKLVSPWR